jgi:circadian clock protein KaiB
VNGSDRKSPDRAKTPKTGTDRWLFRLYVQGESLESLAALANLKKICAKHLAGRFQIEVIDLQVQPKLAQDDQVLAAPTLVRKVPEPQKRMIGDLSDTRRLLEWLEIRPVPAPSNVWSDE